MANPWGPLKRTALGSPSVKESSPVPTKVVMVPREYRFGHFGVWKEDGENRYVDVSVGFDETD